MVPEWENSGSTEFRSGSTRLRAGVNSDLQLEPSAELSVRAVGPSDHMFTE